MFPITYPTWKKRDELCKRLGAPMPRGFHISKRSALTACATYLIERLYVPCTLHRHVWGTVLSENVNTLTKPFDVADEPINWGDLGVVDVQKQGTSWRIFIEEAAPDCPQFCGYIQWWLNKWGWKNVIVETAW